MGRFILIDFKKRQEVSELSKIVQELSLKMDTWISEFQNDDETPPNEAECKTLEDTKLEEIKQEFGMKAATLTRVDGNYINKAKTKLEEYLKEYCIGKLYKKFSNEVEILEKLAESCMKYCMKQLHNLEMTLDDGNFLPTSNDLINMMFNNTLSQCQSYINTSFPEGITGMDSYDDVLPEGILTYPEFKKVLQEKKAEYIQKNMEMIPKAIIKVKMDAKSMIKTKINDAISQAIKEIEDDIADDQLPYLEYTEMETLRAELLATAKEYGTSRLDK